jgi:nicotinamidase-related amidase
MRPSSKPALLIIDAQQGIREEAHWGGNRNNPQAENNIKLLLHHWRTLNFPVIIVQHCSVSRTSPFRPDHTGNKLMDFVKVNDNEKLVQKSTASAFIKTDLLPFLEREKISVVVIAGFVTNNSVEATARNAGDLGMDTIVVSDATACFDKMTINGEKFKSDVVHQLSLANLKDEYASISTTEEIIHALKSTTDTL